MPGRYRRRYGRKRPLSKAAYYIGKQVDRDMKEARMTEALTTAAGYASTAPSAINTRMAQRKAYLQTIGRGGYTGPGAFWNKAERFWKGRVANAIKDRAIGAIKGTGAYYNGLFPNESTSVVPSFDGGAQDELGGIVFSNKEYLGSITATNAFDNTAWELNPGLASTFPFLSQLAANYQEYAFVQLAFVYKTQLSEVTASGSIGSIIMCHNQNPNEDAFRTKSVMLQKIGSISEVPTRDIVCGIECDPSKIANMSNGGKYTRVGEIPSGSTKEQYDWGTFQLATDGMPSANEGQVQGELWVSYTVMLRQPILYAATGKSILSDSFMIQNYTTAGTNDIGLKSPNNSIGCTLKAGSELFVSGVNNYVKVTFPPEMLYKVFECTITFKGARYKVGGGTAYIKGWPSQLTTALTTLPAGPYFSVENCTRMFNIEAGKYAGGNTPYQYEDLGKQRANFIVVPCQVTTTSGNNVSEWTSPNGGFQEDNCGIFTSVVSLDGTFGTESSLTLNFIISSGGTGTCIEFQCDQIMVNVSQINPVMVTADNGDYVNYYADWQQVYTKVN